MEIEKYINKEIIDENYIRKSHVLICNRATKCPTLNIKKDLCIDMM